MQRTAKLFLTTGMVIMIVTLTWASIAMQTTPTKATLPTPDACLNCHDDAHADWDIATDAELVDIHIDLIDDTNTFCLTCHQTGDDMLDSLDNLQHHVYTIQNRLETVRRDLNRVYAHYPDWDTHIHHTLKSDDQRTAERIETLVIYVEADGSWGFHDANYTEQLLSEAETLMAELLDALEIAPA